MMNPRFLSAGNSFSTGSGDLLRWLTWLWLGCALVSIVVCQRNFYTQSRYGKRQESEGQSLLWSGNSYGRSDTNQRNTKFVSKAVELSPRGDRFFMGSRYGKRVPTNLLEIPSNHNTFKIALDYLKHVGQLKNKNKIDFDEDEYETRTDLDLIPESRESFQEKLTDIL
ncbi:uncharacterized protein LOC107272067 [Cephus cinctus]|uniref:Uncharacterized protein LOC107272067 n=1 Tax=Cephus cinctus TaxID=211228 RepID=A0AAJ7RQ84_CEPCN|nr:uncharacterized protein LOC107272067 [Cephus cinctus]XP_015604299.1 uncharacterized protein LOC107272067 [Cephus cinctus]XP_015604300.1 uncharacterized protein LOC107272067 [Cephus cinctus]XP_015604301.1 uncharacterized protein LOC107272067 [Cephus cinctus]XP_024945114.1 uncharacterized protein LOC107272067 [Cephus cinctus]XP_024945115.1 uncharacterized protein LOC107272067 [Cephus cinctus]XP_024945116.1 uncharacterized protein LOC107272067 [Cephus cinctus]XP_024945118.1 uncharacterized p